MTTLITLFMLALFIFCWWGWYHHWQKNKKLINENGSLKNEIANLKAEHKKLKEIQSKHDTEIALMELRLKDSKKYNAIIFDKIKFYEKKDPQLLQDYQLERVFGRNKFDFKPDIDKSEYESDQDIDNILDKMIEDRKREKS